MQQSQTNNDNMKDMIMYQIKKLAVKVDKNSNRVFNSVLKRECKLSVELLENVIKVHIF